jgi:hypothetical protein
MGKEREDGAGSPRRRVRRRLQRDEGSTAVRWRDSLRSECGERGRHSDGAGTQRAETRRGEALVGEKLRDGYGRFGFFGR